jgi:hypothetical protein
VASCAPAFICIARPRAETAKRGQLAASTISRVFVGTTAVDHDDLVETNQLFQVPQLSADTRRFI